MPTRKASVKPTAATPPVDDPSAIKDPSTRATGGEPMTGAQESYLHTLARQAGKEDELPEEISKAEASEMIDELQEETGRGVKGPKGPSPSAAPSKKPAAKKRAKGGDGE